MGECVLYGNGGSGGSGAPLNFKVVGGTIQPASPSENTIWVNTDEDITSWIFSMEEPYTENLLDGASLGTGYFSTDGSLISATANPEFYTEEYIPVKYGLSYKWSYNVSALNPMWLAIVEYTEGYTFKQRLVPVNSVTGTYQTGQYLPSSSDVIAVRLNWSTFPNTTYDVEFIGINPENIDETYRGVVWFPTGTFANTAFNALKKDSIMIYPRSAKQYIDGTWVNVTAEIYQNGEWANWARYIFKSGEGPLVPIVQYVCYRAGVSHTNNSIVHSGGGSGSNFSVTSTADGINLNGYSMLYARAKCTYNYGEGKKLGIGLSSKLPSSSFAADVSQAAIRPDIGFTEFIADSIETIYSLPIPSGLIAAYIWTHGNGSGEIYDIWME